MTYKKPTPAWLAVLMFGVLLGICLSLTSFTPSHAQEPAATPAAEAAPASAPPACDGTAKPPYLRTVRPIQAIPPGC